MEEVLDSWRCCCHLTYFIIIFSILLEAVPRQMGKRVSFILGGALMLMTGND